MRAASLRLTEPGFVTQCAKRYAALQGESPGQGELRTESWPVLMDASRYPGVRCHR